MKRDQLFFWISTALFSLMMLMSATMYLTSPDIKTEFQRMGFPDFFRIELAIAKGLGAIALILPFVPKGLKIFAYVGFTINLTSAIITHVACGDPIENSIAPLLPGILLIISYLYYQKTNPIAKA